MGMFTWAREAFVRMVDIGILSILLTAGSGGTATLGQAPVYSVQAGDAPTIQVLSFDGKRAELLFGPIVAVFEKDIKVPGTTGHKDTFVPKNTVWLLSAPSNPAFFSDKQVCALPVGKNRWGKTLMCGSLDGTQRVKLEYLVPEGAGGTSYPEALTWALYEKEATPKTPLNIVAWVGQPENSQYPFVRHDNVRVNVTVLVVDPQNKRVRLVPQLSPAEREKLDAALKALR